MTYEATGPVRGSCGHKHNTIFNAARCMRDDQVVCDKLRGYSDRTVQRTDGMSLNPGERNNLEAAMWDV